MAANIVCTPPHPATLYAGGVGGVEPPAQFSERGGLTGPKLLEVTFFKGVAIFT